MRLSNCNYRHPLLLYITTFVKKALKILLRKNYFWTEAAVKGPDHIPPFRITVFPKWLASNINNCKYHITTIPEK